MVSEPLVKALLVGIMKTSAPATPNVEGPSNERGRDEVRKPPTKESRTKSRDAISSLDARMGSVQDSLGELFDRVDNLEERCNGLEAEDTEIHAAVKGSLNELDSGLRKEIEVLKSELAEVRDHFQREINRVLLRVEDKIGDLALCKRAMASGMATTTIVEAKKVEVPKPKVFNGARNAREVENFLWGLERYFEATGITDHASKIRMGAMYLTDTAMLWWRRRHGDVQRGVCTIDTFDDFKRELKSQFFPVNAEEEARGRLRRLKQSGSIRDYVKEFTTLLLEVPDTSDKDALFLFMDGL